MGNLEDKDLLGGLPSGLAHDINVLLTPIKTFFQVFRTNPERAKNIQNRATEYAELLADLIHDACVFSRDKRLEKSVFDLSTILKRAIRPAYAQLRERGITLETDWKDNPRIEANCFLVQRLFTNLVQNSIAGDARTIRFSSRKELNEKDSWNLIEIVDDGIGIEESLLQHVLEPGFSTKASSGLGLAIAEKIVRIHNGRMELDSKPAMGTAIKIYLPG